MKKIGGVIVTHGRLANELLGAAEQVVGDLPHISAVSIGWHDNVEAAQAEIERAIEGVSSDRGVLLLTDMFGGTPTNISAMFIEQDAVEVVTGVNLPMVIKLAAQKEEMTLADMAETVKEQGKEAIYRAVNLLEPQRLRKDA